MKGDRVEVIVDVGTGVREFEVAATKAGRRVDVTVSRGTVEVAEVTRSGQPVRASRFMQSRVIAVVEHPAMDDQREPTRRRGARSEAQPSLGLGDGG